MFHISPKLDKIFSSIRQRLEAAVGQRPKSPTPQKSDPVTPADDDILWIAVPVRQTDDYPVRFMDAPTIKREANLLGTYLPEKFDPSWFEKASLPGMSTPAPSASLSSIGKCELLNEFLARRAAG